MQETIIKAWQGLPAWHGDGSLPGWVLSIARDAAVSYLRRIRGHVGRAGPVARACQSLRRRA